MVFSWLDRYLDSFYDEKNIPGVGCSVYRYGKLLHTHCAGYANVEKKLPFTEKTIVNLYSATKLSTVTSGMRLTEQGLLDLDAPVSEYLPFVKEMRVLKADGSVEAAKETMKVRHLFSMSAGFSYADCPSVRALKEKCPAPTTMQAVEALAREPLLFEPGTHFKYSFCHDVLAAVQEAAAGRRFSEILKQNVFDPAGMTDTAFHLKDEQLSRVAPEYHGFRSETGTADRVVLHDVDMGMGANYESGGGGLKSTLADYGLLAAALANGGVAPNGNRILTENSIRLMQMNQQTQAGLADFAEMGGWSKDGYGYGLGVRTLMDRERNNALTENGEFGWDGALGCYLAADPKTGIGIMYVQQEGGSQWWTWHGTVRNIAVACALGGL